MFNQTDQLMLIGKFDLVKCPQNPCEVGNKETRDNLPERGIEYAFR